MMELYSGKALAFAESIIGKYKNFGRSSLDAPPLVLTKRDVTVKTPILVKWNLIGKTIYRHFKEEIKSTVKEAGNGEFSIYHSISTIFENRQTQPDKAKKAEKKLVQILADDFFERTETIQQLKEQKQILRELKQAGEKSEVSHVEIDKIAAQVMKKMEREMHLERLRRGL